MFVVVFVFLASSAAFAICWVTVGYMARHTERPDVPFVPDPTVVAHADPAVDPVLDGGPAHLVATQTQAFVVEVDHGDLCPIALDPAMLAEAVSRLVNRNGLSHVVTVHELVS